MAKTKNEQFFEHANEVRKELDPKIDTKVSYQVFIWVSGLLLGTVLGLSGVLYTQVTELGKQVQQNTIRIVVLETLNADGQLAKKNNLE